MVSNSDSSNNGAIFQIERETLNNSRDSISMIFQHILEIDTVLTSDKKFYPQNQKVTDLNKTREKFKNRYVEIETVGNKQKPLKPQTGISRSVSRKALKTMYSSFEMTFHNHLQECCLKLQNAEKKYEESKKKIYEENVLKDL